MADEIDDRRVRIVADDADGRGLGPRRAGGIVAHGEVDVFAGRDDQRRPGRGEHREAGRAHQALHAGDHEVRHADVEDLERQVTAGPGRPCRTRRSFSRLTAIDGPVGLTNAKTPRP